MEKRKRALEVIERLKRIYEPKTALNFSTPWELLVATILSAQTTDERVNTVTNELFKKYKTIEDYANVPLDEFEKDIRTINYYKTKAKNIKSCAQIILKNYNGKIPDNIEELMKLPGVARKTANVVLSSAFGKNEGIVIDTHVFRITKRLDFSQEKNREKMEKELMSLIPREEWANYSFLLIHHGRNICKAKNPLCNKCIIIDLCPSGSIIS
jgi:endonuclease-3